MPATAGRVRMPANNRVHSSAALQTSDMWQTVIRYDPYAPTNKQDVVVTHSENPYTNFQTLMDIAKLSSFNPNESRGSCKRCGRVGHLTFQCRNFLSLKEKDEQDRMHHEPPLLVSGPDKNGSEEDEEESETSSDSEVDSEIERIIAKRNGNGKPKSSSSKKKDVCDEDGLDSDCGRRKRGRSKKRRSDKKTDSSDSESEDETRRKKMEMDKRKRRRPHKRRRHR